MFSTVNIALNVKTAYDSYTPENHFNINAKVAIVALDIFFLLAAFNNQTSFGKSIKKFQSGLAIIDLTTQVNPLPTISAYFTLTTFLAEANSHKNVAIAAVICRTICQAIFFYNLLCENSSMNSA